MRLRWIEKNIDRHVFCNGNLMKRGKGERPSSKVFDRNRYMEKIAEENS